MMNKLVLFLFVLFCGFGTVAAQEMILDPAQYVNTQIIADTLADGTQAHLVYKAESGTYYAFDGTMDVDFDLIIEGPDNGWIGNDATPPVFFQTPANDGSPRDMIELREGGSATLKNILFSGLHGNDVNISTFVRNFAGYKMVFDNCVFADHRDFVTRSTGATEEITITNTIFINGDRRSYTPYGGMPIRLDTACDNLLLENNTVVNSGRLLGNGGNFFTSNFHELHCTYLNAQLNGHELHWFEGIQANNIFYNWSCRGRTESTNYYEKYFTTFEFFSDVKFNLESIALYNGRNLFYTEPAITNYYHNELADSVMPCLLWNPDVDSTILADDNFTIGKNYGDFDPGFITPPGNTDKMMEWLFAYWNVAQRPAETPDWRVASPLTWDSGGSPVLNWPPAFNLSYSNTYLRTAGTDGLPLGDLNWFPTQKAIYEANKAIYVAALQDSMTNATNVYVAGESSTALIRPSDVAGAIHVSPGTLDFGIVLIGESKTDSISISNNGEDTLHINNINIAGDTASVFSADTSTISIAPGDIGAISVTFAPMFEDTYIASINIASDSGNVDVGLKGFGSVKRPMIFAVSDSIDFGQVLNGTAANDSVAIFNIGSDALHVDSLSISGNDTSRFSIDTTTFTLSPGDSQFVKVTFMPDSGGTFNASLDIDSDGGSVNVRLKGAGLETVVAQDLTLSPALPVNMQIVADTLADGSRAHSKYLAESGVFYFFDGFMDVDFDLVIEGPDNGWIMEDVTPPCFIKTAGASGLPRDMFVIIEGGSITLKNILISGLRDNEIIGTSFVSSTAGDSIIADNCVFTDFKDFSFRFTGKARKISFTNCVFINGVRHASYSPFGGIPVRIDAEADNILLENNTVVNSGRLLGNGGNFFTSSLHELHCTYLNSQVNNHELHWFEGIQANNIFYNWSWRGSRELSIDGKYFTSFETFSGVSDKLDSIALYNGRNLFYREPTIIDYYNNELADGEIIPGLLWNLDVDTTIEADDNFTIGKNYGDSDPGFTTPPGNTDKMLEWLYAYWIPDQRPADVPDWRIPSPVTYDNDGQPVLNWPPAFNLNYSNSFLQRAGTDGLPLGDLNWFPVARASYLTNRDVHIAALRDSMANATDVYTPGDDASALIIPVTVSVEDFKSGPGEFYLSQNYPNPFNPNTTIRFSLPQTSDVVLEVYNSLGQKIKTLLKGRKAAGWHDVKFNRNHLASGIYYYRIHAGDFVQVKKMLVIQ